MSACLIIKLENEFVLGVDSVQSRIDENGVTKRRKGIVVNKLNQVGKDVVFVSGGGQAVVDINRCIHLYLNDDGHIDVEELQKDLIENYPLSRNPYNGRYLEYGVCIFRFEEGKSKLYSLSQLEENNIIIPVDNINGGVQLFADGFKSEEMYQEMLRQFNHRGSLNIFGIYQENYCEEMGGEIFIYRFNKDGLKLIESKLLDEKKLLYTEETMINNSEITHATNARISGDITSSSINGSTLRGNDVFIKDKLYIYSTSSDDNGNIGGDFEALKIIPTAWTSGNTSYELYVGNDGMESVVIPTNLAVRTINGGTPITSNNYTQQIFNNWTEFGNLRTGGLYNLASVDYVQNNFARLSALSGFATTSDLNAFESRLSKLESK